MRFDGPGVAAAAMRLEVEADAARRLAAAVGALGEVAGGALEDALGEGLRLVANVCGDVLEVVGLDLDVLAEKARAAARAYDAIERAAVRAAEDGRRAR